MSIGLGMNKKNAVIFVLLISSVLWFYPAFAQDTSTNLGLENTPLRDKINAFDHLLNIGVVAPLTALSLTGATFLTRSSKIDSEDSAYTQLMHGAKKNLIRAFVLFLACTIAVFVFDFIELLLTTSIIVVGIIDLLVSYSLLFSGFAYLTIAAKKMYLTQAK